MGMFDKDAFFESEVLTEWIDKGEGFILWGVRLTGTPIHTSIGEAYGAILEVSPAGAPMNVQTVSTFASAIVERVKDAEPEDFPCMVQWDTVGSSYGTDATILKFIGPYAAEKAQS